MNETSHVWVDNQCTRCGCSVFLRTRECMGSWVEALHAPEDVWEQWPELDADRLYKLTVNGWVQLDESELLRMRHFDDRAIAEAHHKHLTALQKEKAQ